MSVNIREQQRAENSLVYEMIQFTDENDLATPYRSHGRSFPFMRNRNIVNTALLSMRTYTTFILCLTAFFIFADQNVLAPNLTAVAEDFGFNSKEKDQKLGGNIALGFFVVGGPIALLLGYLADIMNRTILFSAVVIIGEGASLCIYWIETYEQLFICRVLTGISVGGAAPIIFSLLGDLYPGNSRVYVATLFGTSAACGTASGQLVSGLVGPSLGWRAPFLMVAAPAILCSLMVLFTVDEPPRGHQEKAVRNLRERRCANLPDGTSTIATAAPITTIDVTIIADEESNKVSPAKSPDEMTMINPVHGKATKSYTASDNFGHDNSTETDPIQYEEKIECGKVLKLMQTPSAIIIFCQGLPGCLPWGMISVFLNDYLSENRGMTVQAATAVITTFNVGGLFGQLFGGWFGQRLYNKDPRWQCVLMGTTTMLAVPPLIYVINSPVVGDPGFYFMALLGGFLISMNGPNVKVVLQNVCTPEIRGTAFAIFNLTDDVGKGLGPELVVFLVTGFGGNRRHAFTAVTMFWLMCGVLILSLVLFVTKDEEKVNQSVQNSLLKLSSQVEPNINDFKAYTQQNSNFRHQYTNLSPSLKENMHPDPLNKSSMFHSSAHTSFLASGSHGNKETPFIECGFVGDTLNPLIVNETYNINLNPRSLHSNNNQPIRSLSGNNLSRVQIGDDRSSQHIIIDFSNSGDSAGALLEVIPSTSSTELI